MAFLDVCRFTAVSSGTGSFVVSAAVTGYQTPESAGAVDGTLYRYRAESADLSQWEMGYGVYTVSSTTLTRLVITANSSGGASAINFSAAPQVAVVALTADLVILSGRNIIHNGDFSVSQRNGTTSTTTADNAYWGDRWRYVGEASADLQARASGIGGSVYAGIVKLTGTTDKGGIFQVVEGVNCKHLRSAAVVLSATILVSNARIGNIKMGIAEFTGTEDATTGDPVTTWGADGTTPTLAAGWAFINTPANISATTSAVRYYTGATCGASMNNLAVIIWNDDKTYTANDTFTVTQVQLEAGTIATAYERINYSEQLQRCQRYYHRRAATSTADPINIFHGFSTTAAFGKCYDFPVEMRSTPTVSVSSNAHLGLLNSNGSSVLTVTGSDFTSSNKYCVSSYSGVTVASGLPAANAAATQLVFQSASGWIQATADL